MNEKSKRIISSLVIATMLTSPVSLVKANTNIEIKNTNDLQKVNVSTTATFNKKLALAKEESKSNKEIKVYFNGEQIKFDQKPIIIDGRTKVPFRAIFETMGSIVYYKERTKTILAITRNGDTIYHTVGTNVAKFNGVEKTYDSASEIINGRTLIPVRMVSDLLGAIVEWNENDKTIKISKEIITNEYHQKIKQILECALDQNFNPEDFKRYMDYQYKNWGMDPKQVILNVNMDLDLELVQQVFINPYRQGSEPGQPYQYYGLGPKPEDITYVEDLDSNTVLVNKFNVLPEDYVPSDLVTLVKNEWPHGGIKTHLQLRNKVCEDFKDLNSGYCEFVIANPNEPGDFYNPCLYGGWLSSHWQYNLISQGFEYKHEPYEAVSNLDIVIQLENVSDYHKMLYASGHTYDDVQTGLSVQLGYNLFLKKGIQFKIYMGLPLDEKEKDYQLNIEPMKYDGWLVENAHKYGFIQRYPHGKEHITRMRANYEIWRYVGKDVAKIMYEEGLCLEEYCAKYESKTGYKTTEDSIKKLLLKF